jgi:drug/metabolite transporter (DMT)-like permease
MLVPAMIAWGAQPFHMQRHSGGIWLPTASLAWLGIVGTGLTGVAFVRLIQLRGPLYAGMASYLVPILALAWGAYDNEPITMRQVLAISAAVSMVILVQSSSPKYTPERDTS